MTPLALSDAADPTPSALRSRGASQATRQTQASQTTHCIRPTTDYCLTSSHTRCPFARPPAHVPPPAFHWPVRPAAHRLRQVLGKRRLLIGKAMLPRRAAPCCCCSNAPGTAAAAAAGRVHSSQENRCRSACGDPVVTGSRWCEPCWEPAVSRTRLDAVLMLLPGSGMGYVRLHAFIHVAGCGSCLPSLGNRNRVSDPQTRPRLVRPPGQSRG